MRIHIADDNTLFRIGMSCLCANTWRGAAISQGGAIRSAEKGIELIRALRPAVLIAGLPQALPQQMQAIIALHHAAPDMKLAILDEEFDAGTLLQCWEAGLHAYLTRGQGCEDMAASLHRMLRGESLLPNPLPHAGAAAMAAGLGAF